MRTSRAFGGRHNAAVARRARRGEGTVYYSKAERRWIARFPLGVVKGKRISERAKRRTEREARFELERFRRIHAAGVAPVTGTLDEYLEGWLNLPREIEDSTLVSYRSHVNDYISPILGGIPVMRLRPADVDRLIVSLHGKRGKRGKPLSATTVRRIVTTLRIALNRAVNRGELAQNVARMVDLPRVDTRPVDAMSAAQADRLLEAVHGHWIEPLVRVLLGSGLRLGEALALNQGDLFLEEGFVRLRKSKTTIRAVPVSEDAVDALRLARTWAPRRGDDQPVFYGPKTGDRLRSSTVSHALPLLLERAGLPRVTPHGLRHGAATLMVAGGVHMRVVAEQLGHRNPALTARVYAHVVPEVQREAVQALPRRREVR